MSILMTSEEVSAAIKDKVPTGTRLDSKQISEQWDDSARARAMFSARVARSDILAGFQRRIQQVVDGKLSENSARVWMRKLIESKGDSVMAEMGFKGVKEGAAGDITELASDARLNLIIDTNVAIAHAASRYQKVQDIKQVYPYVRYRSKDDGRVRPSHRALNGKVFRTDSNEAALLWPPNGFRCRCEMIPINQRELQGDDVQESIPAEYLEKRATDKDTFKFDPRQAYPTALTPRDTWTPEARQIYVDGTVADIDVEIDHYTKQRQVWLDHAAKAKKPSEIARGLEAANDMEQRLVNLQEERRRVIDFGKQPPPPAVPVPVPTPPPAPVPIVQPTPTPVTVPVQPVPVVPPVPVAPAPTPVKIKLTPEQKLDKTINVDLPKKLNEIEDKYTKAEEKAKASLKLKIKEMEDQADRMNNDPTMKPKQIIELDGKIDNLKVKLLNIPQQIAETKIRLSEEAVIRSMKPHIGDFVKAKQLEDKSAQLPFSNKGLSKEEKDKNADIRKEALDAHRAFDKAREVLGKRLLSVFGEQIPEGMTIDIQDDILKNPPYGDIIKNGIEASAKVAKSSRFEGKRIVVRRSYRENEGASCRFGDIYLSEKYYEEDVTAHEFGHSVEFHEPDIDKKSREYLAYRAKGKELKKLADKYPNAGYDDDEMFYEGAFPQDYTGRIYKDGGTEVMSRGMEYFMTDVIGFALRDAGHFAFTLRQILKARGGLWK